MRGLWRNEGEMKGGDLKETEGESITVVKTCPGWITKPGIG